MWQVRRQMEVLLFNLETQHLHVSRGSLRWLQYTNRCIAPLLERLRFEALALDVEAASLASSWGGAEKTGLPALIALAPAVVWSELFEDHRSALVDLAQEIGASRNQNLQVLSAAEEAMPGLMDGYETDMATWLTIRSNIDHALELLSKSSLPQLDDFLGLSDP